MNTFNKLNGVGDLESTLLSRFMFFFATIWITIYCQFCVRFIGIRNITISSNNQPFAHPAATRGESPSLLVALAYINRSTFHYDYTIVNLVVSKYFFIKMEAPIYFYIEENIMYRLQRRLRPKDDPKQVSSDYIKMSPLMF